MFNDEGECGTGAVVPFADRLWVVTYAPHMPKGSSDKLYEITPDLQQIIRPESIGGTPANRMIHRESNQLFIGPYAIDAERHVRVIPYEKMFGRPTGNARHLSDPANKIYYATMEEGVYEVNVNSLAVTQLWADEADKTGRHADLPGYHGKGFYMGQDRLIYANNGDHAPEAKKNPAVPSGVLATWDGRASAWTTVRRNQFTEVTGPGGILGSSDPENDPVWSIGWDHRSLILMVLDHGTWHTYRLPKSSHSYDGAHGWNTEWPRIREIGDDDTLLMTMHGMFWKFPKTFRPGHTQGIAPRSSYLKVIGDFCRWGDRVVFGCDDTAKNEFLNQRKAKGKIAAPQSQSNLWFVPPDRLDHLGPALGRGAVWLRDDVTPATPSDAFLFSGFDRRALHLHHEGDSAARIRLEIDLHGTDEWTTLQQVELPARGYQWIDLTEAPAAAWVRLVCEDALTSATAWFHFSNRDERPDPPAPLFAGIATPSDTALTGGIIRARGGNKRTLHFTAIAPAVNDSTRGGTRDVGLYELSADLQLTPVDDDAAARFQKTQAAIPVGVLQADAASVLFIDDQGQRWRLPRGDAALDRAHPLGPQRIDREVATERDLFNAYGTFFELPADNAGGFSKLRPVTTHNLCIHDYCSYRGLFVVSGIANDSPPANEHIIRSSDGQTALWVGAVDDIWQMGKPRGHGGPWLATTVKANEASDPYLMTGYDRKTLTLESDQPTTVSLQIDIDGTGLWQTYRRIELTAGTPVKHEFPAAFQAYWLRTLSSADATVTVQLDYR
ncbi:MAG: hypothetical protein KDK99_20815 [Verrucomicrobiales bacterium]|nr:hypothetical protein [Verrucomicrobiales bacterium]